MKKLTIIVPVFNGEHYVERCIKSLINSSLLNIEIILVNDGSTDKTGQLCCKYADIDKRILYYEIANSGVAHARNFGMEHSTGDYVVFVDSDDAVADGYIDFLYDFAGSADFIMTGYSTIDINDKRIVAEFANCNCAFDMHDFCRKIPNWFSPPYLLSPWGKIFRRDLLVNNNICFPEDMNYGEDVIFVMDYLKTCKSIRCLNNPGYLYSVGSANALTGKFNELSIDYDVIGVKRLEQLLRMNNVQEKDTICQTRLKSCFNLYVKRLLDSNKTFQEKNVIFKTKAKKYIDKNIYILKNCSSKGDFAVAIALRSRFILYLLDKFSCKLMR